MPLQICLGNFLATNMRLVSKSIYTRGLCTSNINDYVNYVHHLDYSLHFWLDQFLSSIFATTIFHLLTVYNTIDIKNLFHLGMKRLTQRQRYTFLWAKRHNTRWNPHMMLQHHINTNKLTLLISGNFGNQP